MSSTLHDRVIKSIKARKQWVMPLPELNKQSKAELKEMLKQAAINTAKIKVNKK